MNIFECFTELISTHYGRLCLVVLQSFRTNIPTEPLNFVKYFASFFRRNKTKIRCNYWENVKFSKVEQAKLGSNHWFSNTYLRLILMITYANIIAFNSFEIFTLFSSSLKSNKMCCQFCECTKRLRTNSKLMQLLFGVYFALNWSAKIT